jgi:hypothetical protein
MNLKGRALEQCQGDANSPFLDLLCKQNKQTSNKLHGLSQRANYTDRATAACRQSDCQLFADRECHVVSVTDPYNRILGFLNRSRYFSIK